MKRFVLILICFFLIQNLYSKEYDDLVEAIKSNDVESFKNVFSKNKYSITERDSWGLQPVHYAASFDYSDDLDILKYILSFEDVNVEDKVFIANPEREYYDYRDFTPLIVAAFSGNINALKYLIKKEEADVEYKTYSSNTAMDYACMNGHLEIVMTLLPMLKNKTVSGAIPHLNWAVMYENSHIAKYLIKSGVDLNSKYDTPILIESLNYYNAEIFMLIIKRLKNINVTDRFGSTALITASYYGRINAIKELIKGKADLDIKGEEGDTALHIAVKNRSISIVQELIKAGAKSDIKNDSGKTPMDIAIENNLNLIVKIINKEIGYKSINFSLEDEVSTGIDLLDINYGDFTFRDLNGKKVSLSDYKGKVIFLNIWATWCPPCRREMPEMEKLSEMFKNKDFVILAVSVDKEKEDIKSYLKSEKLTFKILHDPLEETVSKSNYSSAGYPTTYIIDKEGNVVNKSVGSRMWADKNYVDFFRMLIM